MYLFRGEAPLHEMGHSMPKLVAIGLKLFGRMPEIERDRQFKNPNPIK